MQWTQQGTFRKIICYNMMTKLLPISEKLSVLSQ